MSASNFMQVFALCFVCRKTAPNYPAPDDWTEWERRNTTYPYYLSSCPGCSELLTSGADIFDELRVTKIPTEEL